MLLLQVSNTCIYLLIDLHVIHWFSYMRKKKHLFSSNVWVDKLI